MEPHRKSKDKLVILSNYKWGSSVIFNFSLSLKCFFSFARKKAGAGGPGGGELEGGRSLGGGGGGSKPILQEYSIFEKRMKVTDDL